MKYKILYEHPVTNVPTLDTIRLKRRIRFDDHAYNTMDTEWMHAVSQMHNTVIQEECTRELYYIYRESDGMLGGLVEGPHNLSQDGSCWIAPNAAVFGSARVTDDAVVGNMEFNWYHIDDVMLPTVEADRLAWIRGQLLVGDGVHISDTAKVYVIPEVAQVNGPPIECECGATFCGYIGTTAESMVWSDRLAQKAIIKIKDNAVVGIDNRINMDAVKQPVCDMTSTSLPRTLEFGEYLHPTLIMVGSLSEFSKNTFDSFRVMVFPHLTIGKDARLVGTSILHMMSPVIHTLGRCTTMIDSCVDSELTFHHMSAVESTFTHLWHVSAQNQVDTQRNMDVDILDDAVEYTASYIYKNVQIVNSSMGILYPVIPDACHHSTMLYYPVSSLETSGSPSMIRYMYPHDGDVSTTISSGIKGSDPDHKLGIANSVFLGSVHQPFCGTGYLDGCLVINSSTSIQSHVELMDTKLLGVDFMGTMRAHTSTLRCCTTDVLPRFVIRGALRLTDTTLSAERSNTKLLGRFSMRNVKTRLVDDVRSKNGVLENMHWPEIGPIVMNKVTRLGYRGRSTNNGTVVPDGCTGCLMDADPSLIDHPNRAPISCVVKTRCVFGTREDRALRKLRPQIPANVYPYFHINFIWELWSFFRITGTMRTTLHAIVPIRRKADGSIVTADIHEIPVHVGKPITFYKTKLPTVDQTLLSFSRAIHAIFITEEDDTPIPMPNDHGLAYVRWNRLDVMYIPECYTVQLSAMWGKDLCANPNPRIRIDLYGCVPYKIMFPDETGNCLPPTHLKGAK